MQLDMITARAFPSLAIAILAFGCSSSAATATAVNDSDVIEIPIDATGSDESDRGTDAPSAEATIESGDGSTASMDAAGCPQLVGSECWQRFINEYTAQLSCFSHRSLCDRSESTGDPSQCGTWTDPSKTLCAWLDGSHLQHSSSSDILIGSDGRECYRREPGSGTYLFGDRTYQLVFKAGIGELTCPGNTKASAPNAEFIACGPRGICCTSQTPPACEPFPT